MTTNLEVLSLLKKGKLHIYTLNVKLWYLQAKENIMRKLSSFISLLALVFLISLLVWGCSSTTTQTPVTTTFTSASTTSPNELDIDSALLRHIINTATIDHGKQVLAKLLVVWAHGYGHGPFQHNQDGSWLATLWVGSRARLR